MQKTLTIFSVKTSEITAAHLTQLVTLFNKVFDKNYTEDYFKEKYSASSLGYSYHSLLLYEDTVVGAFSVIPNTYTVNGELKTLGLACDALIDEHHRKEELMLKKMFDALTPLMVEEKIQFLVSIPNTIAYPYWKYIVKWKDIGDLAYYILPVRSGKLIRKKWSGVLNVLNVAALYCAAWLSGPFLRPSATNTEHKPIGLLKNEAFLQKRFPSSSYLIIDKKKVKGFVRFYKEDGVNVAYIVDCIPFNKRNMAYLTTHLIRHYSHEIDTVMYIGHTDCSPGCLIKVPKNKEPRRQPFIGKAISDPVDSSYWAYTNWSINLTDFDNR